MNEADDREVDEAILALLSDELLELALRPPPVPSFLADTIPPPKAAIKVGAKFR